VISDNSIVVGGSYGAYPYATYTGQDVFVMRTDMASGASEFKRFIGPGPDQLYYLAATRSGAVYIAGYTILTPTAYRATDYVRQVW
jgi:hypothetical protein